MINIPSTSERAVAPRGLGGQQVVKMPTTAHLARAHETCSCNQLAVANRRNTNHIPEVKRLKLRILFLGLHQTGPDGAVA